MAQLDDGLSCYFPAIDEEYIPIAASIRSNAELMMLRVDEVCRGFQDEFVKIADVSSAKNDFPT